MFAHFERMQRKIDLHSFDNTSHPIMSKSQFIRVTHVSKRRKRQKKSCSFSKVIPIDNEAKDTIDHSPPPVSSLKISIQNSLLSTQSIKNPSKSTDPSFLVDSVKLAIKKQKK